MRTSRTAIKSWLIVLLVLAANQAGFSQWSTSGNSISSGNFLGTTNAYDLVFKANNSEWMRLTQAGYLGIGITSPASPLSVKSRLTESINGATMYRLLDLADTSNSVRFYLASTGGSPSFQMLTPNTSFVTDIGTGSTGLYVGNGSTGSGNNTYFGITRTAATGGKIQLDAFKSGVGGTDILLNSLYGGYVGIGTSAPATRLHVKHNDGSGKALTIQRSSSSQGNDIYFVNESGSNQWAIAYGGTMSTPDFGIYNFSTASFNFYVQRSTGSVGIGTTNVGSSKLAVEGKIQAREVNVTSTTPFPDYVFDDEYHLQPLRELEQSIKDKKHLPDIPSAAEVREKGMNLGEMQIKLLKKIEELTLYVIDLKKDNERLNSKMDALTTK